MAPLPRAGSKPLAIRFLTDRACSGGASRSGSRTGSPGPSASSPLQLHSQQQQQQRRGAPAHPPLSGPLQGGPVAALLHHQRSHSSLQSMSSVDRPGHLPQARIPPPPPSFRSRMCTETARGRHAPPP